MSLLEHQNEQDSRHQGGRERAASASPTTDVDAVQRPRLLDLSRSPGSADEQIRDMATTLGIHAAALARAADAAVTEMDTLGQQPDPQVIYAALGAIANRLQAAHDAFLVALTDSGEPR